ncbi:MAG: RES family NAD+ phosphorylase [Methylococcaceae bacterium]|nr:RES family NAD+ phosphorylase [Methylococcaceae bacterium]MCI0733019.1 RES family NAD+ phosphorylase [Methylococcaceae bacterium]
MEHSQPFFVFLYFRNGRSAESGKTRRQRFNRIEGLIYQSVLNKGGSNLVLFDVNSATAKDISLNEVQRVSYSAKVVNCKYSDPQKKVHISHRAGLAVPKLPVAKGAE